MVLIEENFIVSAPIILSFSPELKSIANQYKQLNCQHLTPYFLFFEILKCYLKKTTYPGQHRNRFNTFSANPANGLICPNEMNRLLPLLIKRPAI